MESTSGAMGSASIEPVSSTGPWAGEQGLKDKAVSQAQNLVGRARSTAQDRV